MVNPQSPAQPCKNVMTMIKSSPTITSTRYYIYRGRNIEVNFGQIFRVPEVEYISYNMGTQDLPDIYARTLGPAALGLGHIYQRPLGLGIYISQIPLAHVITITYISHANTKELGEN